MMRGANFHLVKILTLVCLLSVYFFVFWKPVKKQISHPKKSIGRKLLYWAPANLGPPRSFFLFAIIPRFTTIVLVIL